MNNEPGSSNPVTTTAKKVDEIVRTAGVISAYLLALFGFAQTPIPKTLSLVTILVTTIYIVQWRWSRLNSRKKTKSKKAGNTPQPFLHKLFEPVQVKYDTGFLLPLTRRRVEFAVAALLTTATLAWTIYTVPAVIKEFQPKSPFLACSEDGKKDAEKFFIIVASPDITEDSTELLIAEMIYDSLVLDPAAKSYEVCLIEKVFNVSTQAKEAAETFGADVMIWGRGTTQYEIHLEVPALTAAEDNLSRLQLEEAASLEFLNLELKQISFVTQFTLSELLVLSGDFDGARAQMERSLVEARQNSLNGKDLARGRYLLGLYYDPYFSPDPDIDRSVAEYSKAIESDETLYKAWLNRGFLYVDLGLRDKARQDFTYLIENGDDEFKGFAYINRSDLQDDPKAKMRDLDAAVEAEPSEGYFYRGREYMKREQFSKASEDFEQAIIFDPEYYENYEYLGLAQLHAREYESAIQTFKNMVPYLLEEDRDVVIDDLEAFAAEHGEARAVVDEIVAILKRAKLQ